MGILRMAQTVLCVAVFAANGYGQITIGGQPGNVVYSNVKNIIQYVGAEDCNGLKAEIEGFKEVFEFENCKIDLRYLAKDTSFFRIKNKAGRVVFDTILVKDFNNGVAYLQAGNRLIKGNTIKKSELKKLESLKIIYPCPWMYEREILEFHLAIVETIEVYQYWKITGGQISDSIRQAILKMKNPKTVYVEGIHYRSACHEPAMDSLVLDVK